MSAPLNQAMLLGDDEPATAAELDRYADAGVRAFLAAHHNADATRDSDRRAYGRANHADKARAPDDREHVGQTPRRD